jgi:Restriction endonuclease
MNPQVFAFAKIDDDAARQSVYKEIKNGKSRFGMWDQERSLHDEYYGANAFLLRIQKGDWLVHVNSPEYGKCVAVQAMGEYQFDDGIPVEWGDGRDFNNYIPVDPSSIVEFERNNPNVLPSVNLTPLRRGQRILAVEDFLLSLDNIRQNRFTEYDEGLKGLAHIRTKMNSEIFPRITKIIQQMNRSKEFENFLHKIFESMPNALPIQNGFGWKSDQGADLIVEFQNPIAGNLRTKLIIQAKSYVGSHYDLNAVDQIKEGIAAFNADGGLLITTAESTEELEDKVRKTSEEIGKPIDVMAGADVAKFVLTHTPQFLIGVAKQ